MKQIFALLVAAMSLSSCTQSNVGELMMSVGDLNADAQISFFSGAQKVKQTSMPRGQGVNHTFVEQVNTPICVQIEKSGTLVGFRGRVPTTVTTVLSVSEVNGAYVLGGNAKSFFYQVVACP